MIRRNIQRVDATTGNLIKGIIWYTVPLIMGTLVQSCFNAIDLMVLGNMADSNAVASVGATSIIIGLMLNFFVGIVNGSKIILAHLFGAKNSSQIKVTVDTSLFIAVGMGLIVTAVGIPLIPSILQITNCPADCFAGAVTYVRIYISAAPAMLLYNFGSAILTASGDSQRPLYYIIISGMVNVILNIILCLILPQKVVAVAVASVVSLVISAILVLRRLYTMDGDGKIDFKNMKFQFVAFKQIIKQGLPLAINSSLYPFANVQIQSAINTFGVSAIAGNAAASTLEGVPAAFTGSFGTSATVFIGQNMGAKMKERAQKSFYYCLIGGCAICLLLSVGMYLTGRFWLSFFVPDDPQGVEYGMVRMFFIMQFYFISAANSVLAGTIQTHGHAAYTSICSILCICVFRLIWMWFIYPRYGTFVVLMACFLVSWSLHLICYIIGYFIFCRKK